MSLYPSNYTSHLKIYIFLQLILSTFHSITWVFQLFKHRPTFPWIQHSSLFLLPQLPYPSLGCWKYIIKSFFFFLFLKFSWELKSQRSYFLGNHLTTCMAVFLGMTIIESYLLSLKILQTWFYCLLVPVITTKRIKATLISFSFVWIPTEFFAIFQ